MEAKRKEREDMAYCVKCGAKVDDGTISCPQCGAPIPNLNRNDPGGQRGYQTQYFGTETHFDQSEVRQNKGMGVLSYLGILVLIPLIAGNKQSQYVKHHVNQGLVLYILSTVIDFIEGDWLWGWRSFFHFGEDIFSWGFEIIDLALLILLVMGIVTACRGEKRELPLIGKIKFFK